jgi:hypothetical protein
LRKGLAHSGSLWGVEILRFHNLLRLTTWLYYLRYNSYPI